MSVNILQQLNTISNPGGVGLPITTYATDMQQALTLQLTKAPNAQLTALNSQQTALNALQTALSQFQQATYTLSSSQNWNSVTASSSNSSAFTATTASGAQASIYNFQVTQLARNQTDILQPSSAQASSSGTSNLVAGTLTITPSTLNSGQTSTINVTAGESLDSIASSVNQLTSTTGVQAQALNTGHGYVLALSSTQSGTANSYTLGGTLVGAGSGQLSNTETVATDAQVTLDGVSLSSSTNTFTNAIPGVTVNVYQTMAAQGTLSVTNDASSSVKAVQTWMSAYNSLIDVLHKDTAFSSSTSSGSGTPTTSAGPLFTDFNANSLLSQLPASVSQTVSTVSSSITSLGSIGIIENPTNGHLEFQSSTGYSVGSSTFSGSLQDGQTMFTNALASNSAAVQAVFGVVQNNSISTAIPQSGILGALNNTINSFLLGQGNQPSAMQSDLSAIAAQQKNITAYLTQVNKQISQSVADFTSQLQQLNTAMQHSQAQMQQLSALFGTSTSSSSSSSGSSTTVG